MQRNNRKKLGNQGELIALEYLQKSGYRIVLKNFRVGRIGEIDIIAEEGQDLCFIEVKARSSTIFGTPAEAVGKSKQENIKKIANVYLLNKNLFDRNIRFDVIEILFEGTSPHNFTLNHIKNAF
ncbi:MAG: YraN family protein [Clostridia bacterium]|nr:YraN family protein [Clostridia bacterium]